MEDAADAHVDKKRKTTSATSKSTTPDRKNLGSAPSTQDKDSTKGKARSRQSGPPAKTKKPRLSNVQQGQSSKNRTPVQNGTAKSKSPPAVPAAPKSPSPNTETVPDISVEKAEDAEPELPPTPVQLGLEPRPIPGSRVPSSLGTHMSSSPSKRKSREKGKVRSSSSRLNGTSSGSRDRKSGSKDTVNGPVEPPARVVAVLTDDERVQAAEARRAKREEDFRRPGDNASVLKTASDYLVLSKRVLQLLPFPLSESLS